MNEGQNLDPAEAERRSTLSSRIRPLGADTPDELFLPFLDLCFNWSMDKPRVEVDELVERDDAAFYFKDWGRNGDIAVAAYASDPNTGDAAENDSVAGSEPEIVGLAWLRLAEFDAVMDRSTAAPEDTASDQTTAGAQTPADSDNSDDTEASDDGNATDTIAEVGPRFTGYGWVAADIPELSLAVLPDHQSQGIGGMLLDVVCTLAKMSGFPAVSLSVEDGNGAARLYHDRDFVAVGRNGDADILVRRLK
ncbi:GNAT family N-acetyltransferase [Brevibacterium aurantiacum]|uniref:Acetyltransferase (GNAT) family protein n=1 Tax=Brevibacterium aurantiacum TaxID=273384 RepID=A0A2H1K8R9_BREAU|nr:GNAT family N-acetyltransferase [Brevibacterium aurantiacum]SMX96217.1 Acetyltransferase (GNAT) family protein [Brevibacterium aurantiacum]